ncbi:MAG: alanine racemase [bacterium]|nr:alanine racemase [bacterium]
MTTPLSYIELSKDNLLSNINNIKSILPKNIGLGCVVKANAYGHGYAEIVNIIKSHVDYLLVDDFSEFKKIRNITDKPIILLGYVSKDELLQTIELDGILAVYDIERLPLLDNLAHRLNKRVKIHIKIDAHLGRQGILVDAVEDFIVELKKYKNIAIDGVYAHFANIEDTSDVTHAEKQISEYKRAIEIFQRNGYDKIESHISSTSGILAYEQKSGSSSLVRFGIGLYGLWPSEGLRNIYGKNGVTLKPVMRWITHVAQVKTLPANYPIGYGITFVTSKKTKIAIIPQGYSDGYDRSLSNVGEVLIHGTRCRVLGRVSMNIFTVDVTHLPDIKPEDEVVLLGQQDNEIISAEEIAQKINTINYEVVARVSWDLPRTIV